MKSFGEIAYKWKFSDKKKSFIKTSIITNSGISATIFRDAAISCDLPHSILKFLAKNLNITGYRIEEKPFREKAIPKLIQAIEKGQDRFEQPFLDIYSIACVHYLKTKLKDLNQLLLNERPDKEPTTAEEFFKTIALLCPKYSVQEEQLQDFNIFWRFDIIENFKETVFTSEYQSFAKFETLIRKFKIEEFDVMVEDLKLLKEEFGSLNENLRNLPNLSKISLIIDDINQNIENLKIEIENRFSSIPAKIGVQMGTLSKSVEELRNTVNKNQNLSTILKRTDELERKVEKIEKRLVTANSDNLEKPKVANLENSGKTASKPSPILLLHNFLLAKKSSSDLKLFSEIQIIVFFCLMRLRCPIVLKHKILFESFIESNKITKVNRIHPEATWITSEEVSKHILGKTSEDMVLVNNFEVGVYEAYLIPSIIKMLDEPNYPKMVIVSSDYSDTSPSWELLKVAPILTIEHIEWLHRASFAIPNSIETLLTKNNLSVNSDTNTPPEGYVETIGVYSRSSGIDIPPELIRYSGNFCTYLKDFLSHEDSLAISIEIILKPYLIEKFGRDLSSNFFRLVNPTVGNKLEMQ